MSYPAEEAFARDHEVTYARWRVWRALQPPFLTFGDEPRAVKISVLQSLARVSTRSVIDALAWMERKGYVRVKERDRRGTPSLSLAWALPETEHSRTEAAS